MKFAAIVVFVTALTYGAYAAWLIWLNLNV
jgi:hypothetical protein